MSKQVSSGGFVSFLSSISRHRLHMLLSLESKDVDFSSLDSITKRDHKVVTTGNMQTSFCRHNDIAPAHL